MRGVALNVLLLAMACVPTHHTANDLGTSDKRCYTGKVGLTIGMTPQPILATSEKRFVLIPADSEVPASLEGAIIEACGLVEDPRGSPFSRLTVESFDLHAIDDHPAILGRLLMESSGLTLVKADGTTWRLEGAVDGLRVKDGERVWVSGAIGQRSIRVTSYGLVPN